MVEPSHPLSLPTSHPPSATSRIPPPTSDNAVNLDEVSPNVSSDESSVSGGDLNQDPSIPNIPTSDEDGPLTRQKRLEFSRRTAGPAVGLTNDNMRQWTSADGAGHVTVRKKSHKGSLQQSKESSAEEDEPKLPARPKNTRRNRSFAQISRSRASNEPHVSGGSTSSKEAISYDIEHERLRIRRFFQEHGYLPAPKQAPDAVKRRLKMLRQLGLEDTIEFPNNQDSLDRFTRLAASVFKAGQALISIFGRDKQYFLSKSGLVEAETSVDCSFCGHTISATGNSCVVVPDAAADWRFRRNPLVDEGKGSIQFYAGAPLRFGEGAKSAVIGSLCIIDEKPREFDAASQALLMDLADCVVSEVSCMSAS